MAFFQSLDTQYAGPYTDNYVDLISSGELTKKYRGIAALKNSDILAGISIIAGDVSSFPIVLTDEKGTKLDMGNIKYMLNTKATAVADARSWRFSMVVQAILSGNSYSRILRDPVTNEPLELEYFTPSETKLEITDDKRELIYVFNRDGKDVRCRSDDVFHLKFFTHDTILGRSPLLSLDDEIDLQEKGRKTLAKFFGNGMASGVLKVIEGKLSKEAKNKVREQFEETRDNSSGSQTIILDSTMEYKPLEIDTNVLQLINSNNYSTAQIAKCLRIPAYKLGVNSPNQSVEQLNRDYVNNDLVYYMHAFISEANVKFLTIDEQLEKTYSFDTSRITDVDTQTKVENVKNQLVSGLMTINEGRAALGREPIADKLADKTLVSLNYTFLDTLIERQSVKGGGKQDEKD